MYLLKPNLILVKLLLVGAATIFLVNGMLDLNRAQSSSSEERKFKSKEFSGAPVRVRKVKNLQSATWHHDLEIEVENVSNKPIYFINAVLEFPDDNAPNGKSGILLTFGNSENLDIRTYAKAEDEHVEPGKSCALIIPEMYRDGLVARQKKFPHNFKKLEFWFEIISFGDGTGFQVDQFVDYRKKSGSIKDQTPRLFKKKDLTRPPTHSERAA